MKKLIIIFLSILFLILSAQLVWRYTQNTQNTQSINKQSLIPFDIFNQENQQTTPSPRPIEPFSILFTGDVMLDRSIRVAIDRVGISHVFADLAPVFSSHDAVIMNLEGPITTFPTVSVGTVPGTPNNFRFTFDPSVLEYLKTFPLIVNIGNNHIRDFNLEGVQQTKKYLEEADIPYFGNSGFEAEPSERVLLLENENGTIAYVNYNQFIADEYNTAMTDLEFASTQSSADLVVLYTHWGSEYVEVPNSTIKNQAIAFFDAGADLIVGTHPHVIQPWEDVQGKRVYYSLGNTVFDQYFSAATRRGMLVSAEWDGLDLEFSEQYVLMEGSGRTILEESDLN